jgi:hypothetical protein
VDLLIDSTRPRTYHYQWAHERALGQRYLGRPDYQGCYGGISPNTLNEHGIPKEWLGLKASEWAPAPYPRKGLDQPRFPVIELEDAQAPCCRCRAPGHKATYCPTLAWTICMKEGHSFKVCPKRGQEEKIGKLTQEEKAQLRK